MTEFEFPWPTTLTNDEVSDVIRRLEYAAEVQRGNVTDEPSNYIAAFARAAVMYLEDYASKRARGVAGYQQLQ